MRPRTGPIGGMMTLSTSVVTILPNAAPMIADGEIDDNASRNELSKTPSAWRLLVRV